MTDDNLLDEAVALLIEHVKKGHCDNSDDGDFDPPCLWHRTRMFVGDTNKKLICAICRKRMPPNDRLPYVIADKSHVHAACVMGKQADVKP